MTEPHRWLEFAGEDLVMAQVALEKGIYNQACFHAQQGVEKALKGFLRSTRGSIPKTHALNELVSLCKELDGTFAKIEDLCLKLDQYYIPTRYPDALPGLGPEGMPTSKDAEETVKLLREALDWIQTKIRL